MNEQSKNFSKATGLLYEGNGIGGRFLPPVTRQKIRTNTFTVPSGLFTLNYRWNFFRMISTRMSQVPSTPSRPESSMTCL